MEATAAATAERVIEPLALRLRFSVQITRSTHPESCVVNARNIGLAGLGVALVVALVFLFRRDMLLGFIVLLSAIWMFALWKAQSMASSAWAPPPRRRRPRNTDIPQDSATGREGYHNAVSEWWQQQRSSGGDPDAWVGDPWEDVDGGGWSFGGGDGGDGGGGDGGGGE